MDSLVWTAMAQHRAFANVGPSMWNDLPPTIRSKILLGVSSSAVRYLKSFFYFLGAVTLRAPLNSKSVRGAINAYIQYNICAFLCTLWMRIHWMGCTCEASNDCVLLRLLLSDDMLIINYSDTKCNQCYRTTLLLCRRIVEEPEKESRR
jgi:hypothetical protein